MVDAITLMRREDKAIQIAEEGFSSGVPADKNNAVKAAWAFMERYNTPGVDIYLKRNPGRLRVRQLFGGYRRRSSGNEAAL